jgi:hypothetical protein
MRSPKIALLSLAAAVAAAPVVQAQSPEASLQQGIQAYRDLEMESAGWLLRRALQSNSLSEADRKTGLCYLGAAELYRDRRDSAVSAFSQLIRLEPRYRLDRLVFTPEVQSVFELARRRTPIVEVDVRSGTVAPRDPGLPIHLEANTPHVVVVTAEAVRGEVLDTIARASVDDTATVRWSAHHAPAGGLILGVSSLDQRGRVSRRVELPVQITRFPEDPLPMPEQPAMLPERRPAGPAVVRLGLGVALATTAYLVTPAFTDASAPQVMLTGLFAAAGIAGFVEARPGKPLPDNVVANETAREMHRAKVAKVQEENRRRAEGGIVRVDVGKAMLKQPMANGQ